MIQILKNFGLTVCLMTGIIACDSEGGLEPIEATANGQGAGTACNEAFEATAAFENNFGLQDFCISYADQGGGLVSFDFKKSTDHGVGSFSIALPHTEVGHVFSYNTKEMLESFESEPDHCEMLKSSSTYPMVTLTATDGIETVKASTLDCDKQNFFEVTVNTIQVPEVAGEKWIYELSAKYARQDKGPYFLKGRFEVAKR